MFFIVVIDDITESLSTLYGYDDFFTHLWNVGFIFLNLSMVFILYSRAKIIGKSIKNIFSITSIVFYFLLLLEVKIFHSENMITIYIFLLTSFLYLIILTPYILLKKI